jgi:hypothetical protein
VAALEEECDRNGVALRAIAATVSHTWTHVRRGALTADLTVYTAISRTASPHSPRKRLTLAVTRVSRVRS